MPAYSSHVPAPAGYLRSFAPAPSDLHRRHGGCRHA